MLYCCCCKNKNKLIIIINIVENRVDLYDNLEKKIFVIIFNADLIKNLSKKSAIYMHVLKMLMSKFNYDYYQLNKTTKYNILVNF